jgi:alpha-tubulin suppressor-like RCC1 family protein
MIVVHRVRCLLLLAALSTAHPATADGQLAAGRASTFAIDQQSKLYAWGSDEHGQLGLGREIFRSTPRALPAGRYIAVAVSTYHTLAVRTDGTLWAWGDNEKGQLGNGTTTQSSVPVNVGSGFRTVATDSKSSFGIKNDGSLWAWGANNYGQLGDQTTIQRTTPVLIGQGFASVATSGVCTYALTTGGDLWRWGYCYWIAGDGTAASARPRNPASIGTNFASVSVGASHAVAVKRDGSLWAWGHNLNGEVGDGTTTPRLVPTKVGEGYSMAVAAESLSSHTIALKRDGSLWGWGTNNRGVFGSGEMGSTYLVPQAIGSGYKAVACTDTCLAIKTDGSMWTWGYNYFGQLGDGTNENRSVPKQVGSNFIAVAAGIVAAGIGPDNTLFMWGDNRWGQLGDSSPTMRTTPTLVGTDFAMVETSKDLGIFEFHANSVAVRKDGTLWTWGNNMHGQLGNGTRVNSGTPVMVGTGYRTAVVSSHHGLAIKSDGSLWAWGDNGRGELGDGTTTASLVPVRISAEFVAVGATVYNSVALHRDGTVFTWGSSINGELGDGSTIDRLAPARVPGLSNVTAIARGSNHTLALRSDGTIWGWGRNASGELGDGTFVNRPLPTRISALANVTAIATGGGYSLALRSDGTLWVWGASYTSLGDGTGRLASNLPRQIGSGFSRMSVGNDHAAVGMTDGSVRAWGSNASGRLGDGSVANSAIPVPVVNAQATGFLSLLGGSFDNSLDPLRVLQVVDATATALTTRITDLRAAGLMGDIFFSVIVPPNSPLVSNCTSGCAASGASVLVPPTARRATPALGPLSSKVVDPQAVALADTAPGMVSGVITRGGFKQTGGNSYVQAESAYTGVLGDSGTLPVIAKSVLENSSAIVCVGVTIAELSAKGQVLMRPIATGDASAGVVQCPPVQTAATIAQFAVQVSGPITERTIIARISPLAEDKGRARKAFSWAVAPDGRQYMQTGPNQWEEMTEPMKPVATISLPANGSYSLDVTKNMKLDHLAGTLLFIGIGDSWEDVRGLNKAGHYYTVR